jgi:hypothetical protein
MQNLDSGSRNVPRSAMQKIPDDEMFLAEIIAAVECRGLGHVADLVHAFAIAVTSDTFDPRVVVDYTPVVVDYAPALVPPVVVDYAPALVND